VLGAGVALLGVGEPREQLCVRPGAVEEHLPQDPADLWTREQGHLFPPLLLQGQQEGASEQGQGDVMVPAGPTPHLVFVQAGFAFGRLEFGLDGPAGGRDLGQRQQRGLLGGVGEVVARLAAVEIMPQQLDSYYGQTWCD